MSYTTIIHIYPNEKTEADEELRNSHGSAPYVWGAMCQKYLGDEYFWNMNGQDIQKLWDLWKKKSIPNHQRAVLMMTFDQAYVAKANYKRAAEDIRKFLQDFWKSDVVNHWPRIAEIFESDPDVPGIGLWCTSVSENPFEGQWNEETEQPDPLDWDRVYELYKSLDSLDTNSQDE